MVVLQEHIDGEFISTDIRYRDGPIVPKPKTKRRSASSFFGPDASNGGKGVGVCSRGAKPVSGATNSVSANNLVSGGVGGGEIDVVGGDAQGNLYI